MINRSDKDPRPSPEIPPAPIPGRLLLVDDSKYDLQFLSRGMCARGHEVLTAGDGDEALAILEGTDIDLLLLDGRLPTYDGIEIVRMIRKETSGLMMPIIMTTGWDQPDVIVEALRAGANDFVTKPLDLCIVAARVDTQLSLLHLFRQREEFMAFTTHDLRTPLSVIIGYTSVLRMKQEAGVLDMAEVSRSIEGLHQTASIMAEIVNDFVDFHALQTGTVTLKIAKVNMCELIDSVAKWISDLATKKYISVQVELDDGVSMVMCDKGRIVRVLQNIVGNAIKFCKPGCTVRIRALADGDRVRIEVRDNGPGIGESKKDLFKKFCQRTAVPTGGEQSSGLGLSICKQIVEFHGGAIGADNNPDGGATFWFELPLSGRT